MDACEEYARRWAMKGENLERNWKDSKDETLVSNQDTIFDYSTSVILIVGVQL